MPLHSNPHLLLLSEEVTTRSRLANEGESFSAPDHSNEQLNAVRQTLIAKLDRELGGALAAAVGPSKKRKRRTEDTVSYDPVTSFRLFSGPPRAITLDAPSKEKLSCLSPDRIEDSEEQASIRKQRAASVAVDLAWIQQQSQTRQSAAQQPDLLSYCTVETFPLPHLAVTKPDNKVSKGERWHCATMAIASVNSGCASVDSNPSCTPSQTRSRPHFFRPARGSGGKSMGYAWGFEGSSLLSGATLLYRRDRMRKGVL